MWSYCVLNMNISEPVDKLAKLVALATLSVGKADDFIKPGILVIALTES